MKPQGLGQVPEGQDRVTGRESPCRTNPLIHKNLNIAVKKIQLDLGSRKNSLSEETLKELIKDDDRNNPIFSSINVIYEENNNLDISQLELESEQLMQSIA